MSGAKSKRARGVYAMARAVESLERRSLMSGTVGVELESGVLTVTGSTGADQITVSLAPGGAAVVVGNGANVVAVLPTAAVEELVVTGGGGDDVVTFNTVPDTGGAAPFSTQVVVGDGHDTVVGGDPSGIVASRGGVTIDLVAWTRNIPAVATTVLLPAWTGTLEDGESVVTLEAPTTEPTTGPTTQPGAQTGRTDDGRDYLQGAWRTAIWLRSRVTGAWWPVEGTPGWQGGPGQSFWVRTAEGNWVQVYVGGVSWCHGLTFGIVINGQVASPWGEQVSTILRDEYRETDTPKVGSIFVVYNENGEVAHSGIVTGIDANGRPIITDKPGWNLPVRENIPIDRMPITIDETGNEKVSYGGPIKYYDKK